MAQTVIIIGGVALGPKAACRFKRLEPQSPGHPTRSIRTNFLWGLWNPLFHFRRCQ